MGLAASQARLLFITSRQNDVSAKMQRISNQTMILARDEEDVVNKYNQMLNATTVKLKDGVSLSYDALMGAGAFDSGEINFVTVGAGGIDGNSEYANRVVLNNSIANALGLSGTGDGAAFKEKVANAAVLKEKLEPIVSAGSAGEPKKPGSNDAVKAVAAEFKETYGEYPEKTIAMTVSELISKMGTMSVSDDFNKDNLNCYDFSFSDSDLTKSYTDLINGTGSGDTIVHIANDGNNSGVPYDQLFANINVLGDAVINSISTAFKSLDNNFNDGPLRAFKDQYIEDLKTNLNGFQDKNCHGSEKKARNGAINDAKAGLVGNGTDDTGTDQDFYYINLSEFVRRMISVASAYYSTGSTGNIANSYSGNTSLDKNAIISIKYNSKGYSESDYLKKLNIAVTNANNKDVTSNAVINELKSSSAQDGSGGEGTTGDYYEAMWNKLSAVGWYVDSDTSTLTTKLENGQYQLNNRPLNDNKDLYEEVADKDAEKQAERYYDQEIRKINRKEKQLEQDLQKLQTEYSALTTDYESVKSIITANIGKSFTYCQNG